MNAYYLLGITPAPSDWRIYKPIPDADLIEMACDLANTSHEMLADCRTPDQVVRRGYVFWLLSDYGWSHANIANKLGFVDELVARNVTSVSKAIDAKPVGARLRGGDIALKSRRSIFESFTPPPSLWHWADGSTLSQSLAVACQCAGATVRDICGPSAKRDLAIRRAYVAHLLAIKGYSRSQIARSIKRDHTTVIHALRVIQAQMTRAGINLPMPSHPDAIGGQAA